MTDWQRVQLAETRLVQISQKYARVGEVRKADGTVRHKCFLSYYSADATEVLGFVETFESVFIPRSIGVSDDDGPIINSTDVDYVMDRIRDLYLADSTVTIVMVGQCSWSRKYIDWEVYSSLRRDKVNRLNGLVAIELPSIAANGGQLPSRVADNVKANDAGFARYFRYPTSSSNLQAMIEDAFQARASRAELIDNSRPRRERNSECP